MSNPSNHERRPDPREVVHRTSDDTRRVPWKNGRGTTDELAVWPEHASFARGDFEWRISKASVADAGPFSPFQGFDRILIVTEGAGLTLDHGDDAPRARVRALEPYSFSGDWDTHADLVRGSIRDFNVLLRRGVVDASVEVLRLGERRAREALECSDAFLHVLQGELTARVTGEEDAFELESEESLWIRHARSVDEIDLLGGDASTIAVLVRFRAAR